MALLPPQAPPPLQGMLQLPSLPSFLLAGTKMGLCSDIEKDCKKPSFMVGFHSLQMSLVV